MRFWLNQTLWTIIFVQPNSSKLIDRMGHRTLATTDPSRSVVYISFTLHGELLRNVIFHELAHCVMVSYGLLGYIHKMTKKEYWVPMEELICNIIAEHNDEINYIYKRITGQS